MNRKQAEENKAPGEVICISKEGRKYTRREMELIAEAICKDFPSEEARALIDAQHKDDPQTVKKDGDLMAEALDRSLSGNYLGYVTISAVKLRAEELRRGLGYAAASTAERMLIEHAVVCHARLGVVECLHAFATRGEHNRESGLYWDRRLTMAQGRFDRAMTTLARTRALLARAEAERDTAERAAGRLRTVGRQAA